MNQTRDLAAELTDFYGLPSPIVSVKIWGRRKDAPADIHLKNGTVVRIDPVGDLTKPRETVQTLIPYGARFAEQPKTADLMQRYADLYELAQVDESDSLTAECDEWLQRFLRSTGGLISDWDLAKPSERYEAVGYMQEGRYDPHGGQAAVVRDVGDYGPQEPREVLIRSSDLRVYIERIVGERITAQKLKARMAQAGYPHKVIEAWRPGADRKTHPKRKVAVYVIEPDAVPTSPESPSERPRTHAHEEPRGYTRDKGTDLTPAEAPA